MPRPVVLGIRLSEEDHAALAQAAEVDQRSMSALASKVLVEWLRAHGYSAPTAKAAPTPRRPRAKAKAKAKAVPASMRALRRRA